MFGPLFISNLQGLYQFEGASGSFLFTMLQSETTLVTSLNLFHKILTDSLPVVFLYGYEALETGVCRKITTTVFRLSLLSDHDSLHCALYM